MIFPFLTQNIINKDLRTTLTYSIEKVMTAFLVIFFMEINFVRNALISSSCEAETITAYVRWSQLQSRSEIQGQSSCSWKTVPQGYMDQRWGNT